MSDGGDFMTDPELGAELRRRAQRSSLPSDWTRSQLLPAVHRAVDLTPQRVPTSRLAPVGALVGVGALLLLLAVALPRLVAGPQPSGTAPGTEVSIASPGPAVPIVLTAEQFAHQLRAGSLGGQAVLVDGSIVTDGRRGPECPWSQDSLCYVGTLEGAEIDLYARSVATLEGDDARRLETGRSSWPWWTSLGHPNKGTFLLLVGEDAEGHLAVEYLGHARRNGQALTWTAEEAGAVDPETLDLGEVLVVDAWLTGTETYLRCRGPRASVHGLPSRFFCDQPNWLADQPKVLNPSSFTGPSPAIEVQQDAFSTFAPDPKARVGRALTPQRAFYAASRRLFGAGCANDEVPCWNWSIVARLSTNSEALPTPSPVATPQVAPVRIDCGPFPLVDSTGLVAACQDGGEWLGEGALNPEGDLTQLVIHWTGSSCDDEVELDFDRLGDDYSLVAVERDAPVGCEGVYVKRSVLLDLREAIPANLVHFYQRWLILPEPSPSPALETGPAWWELASTERPTSESTAIDVLVYEFACASGQSPTDRITGPNIDPGTDEITITFSVRPLPGEQDCQAAPGAPFSVDLDEPLGDRQLVDGGFAALGDGRQPVEVVLEHTPDLLVLSSSRIDEMARERLLAMAGPDTCLQTIEFDRAVPTQEELEREAIRMGARSGPVLDGNAFLGGWIDAAGAFGAIEAYAGRPKPWYFVARASDSPMGANFSADALILAGLDPFPVSGGRTIWYPAFYRLQWTADCAEARSGEIPLWTRDNRLWSPDMPGVYFCHTAQGGGHLALHPRSGLGVANTFGEVGAVIWPLGFTARFEDGQAVLLNPSGTVAAHEGDLVTFGGGYGTDDAFAVCPADVQVIAPAGT